VSSVSSALKIGEVVASWLDPEKREKRVLRAAIESGEQLLMILRKQGRYATFSEKALKEHEIHFQKRWEAWKDGTS
jgi:cell division inhibitor SulA